ncbi:unnamed protein product [Arctia plantaginis]|uniref:Uncharacterized protein n=1 Tax=Arctia plantaginis TaxID=874455 RepID=A0A8S0YWX6_ARCPL|nr:unnamed protein product [Arctia plantaginis]
MVVLTRSAYKKSFGCSNSSDVSQKNVIPPWCSSGKVCERRKSRQVAKPKWEMRSTYPLRENIWEYLYENNVDQNFLGSKKRRTKRCKQTSVLNRTCNRSTACLFVILILVMGTIG